MTTTATSARAVRRRGDSPIFSRRSLLHLLSYFILTVGGLVMVVPFLWSIATSFKPAADVFTTGAFSIPWPLDFSAYVDVMGRVNFGQYALNTIKVAGLITLAQLITSSLAGYAFARIEFPGRNLIFLLFLATMMVPAAVTLIPNFITMRTLGLIDSHTGLILPAVGSAYGTFLMRQFYLGFPRELEDAAKLDGCNPLSFYWHVLLPNSTAILAALGLLTFQWAWNDFQWPLVLINSEAKRTLQLGLSYLLNENYINWPWLMAASVMTTLPILVLFLLTQKQFVQSVRMSGIKG